MTRLIPFITTLLLISTNALAQTPVAAQPARGGFTFLVSLGLGVQRDSGDDETERGLGLILGAGDVLLNRGRHNVLANVEYAPALTDPAAVHNLGFTIGYQYHR